MTIFGIKKFLQIELRKYYDKSESDKIISIFIEDTFSVNRTKQLAYPETNLEISKNDLEKTVSELQKYKPIQYITGKSYFLDFELIVDSGVLIPRPETEELAEHIIRKNKHRKGLKILDIGTGSGCIAIALKKYLPDSEVFALDVSAESLNIAKRNFAKHNLNIKTIQADILKTDTIDKQLRFDIIVSNPPYVCVSEKQLMHSNVLDYEPFTALFVPDENPLIFYSHISKFAIQHLLPNGVLYFEINEKFGNEMLTLLDISGFSENKIIKDINNKDRFTESSK